MTPKEKATELVSKFVSISLSQYVDLVDGIRIRLAKQCALITVDEMLTFVSDNIQIFIDADTSFITYWQEVKQEIEKL